MIILFKFNSRNSLLRERIPVSILKYFSTKEVKKRILFSLSLSFHRPPSSEEVGERGRLESILNPRADLFSLTHERNNIALHNRVYEPCSLSYFRPGNPTMRS